MKAKSGAQPGGLAKAWPAMAAVGSGGEIVSVRDAGASGTGARVLTAADQDGWLVLRRSAGLLAAAAAAEALPGRSLKIRHSLGCGVWATIRDSAPGSPDRPPTAREAAALEAKMREMVSADIPITEDRLDYQTALALFAAAGQHDKVGLLRHVNDPTLRVVRLGSFRDLRQGAVAPSTGALGVFSLVRHEGGLVLQLPSQDDPLAVAPFVPQPALMAIHREHARWGDVLGVHSVGELNQAVADRRIAEVIEMSEALHDKCFSRLADKIAARRPRPRIVLLAGPSSAGKTTSCRRLSLHLRVVGLRPVQLSTDDYFVAEKDDPIGPDGKPDYEDIRAVDVKALRADLSALLAGKSVRRRTYDFRSKTPLYTDETLSLGQDGVICLEGIHALNPALVEGIPREATFKIYLSALTQLVIDDNNLLSTSDNRLIRRLVRDNAFRGHDARRTLSMWPSVRRGEEKWIFPYQGEADASFNSSLDYELAVLRPFAWALLSEVKPGEPDYATARRLLDVLSNFTPIPPFGVPPDSILRETIGGSSVRY